MNDLWIKLSSLIKWNIQGGGRFFRFVPKIFIPSPPCISLRKHCFLFWSSKMRSWFQQGPRKRQKKLRFALASITCASQYLWFLIVYSWWEHQRLLYRNIYFQKFKLLGFFSSLNSLVKEKRAASLETMGKNWQKKRTNKIPKKSKSGGKENHKACNMNR